MSGWPEKEEDLGGVLVPWLESNGWEVFQEAQARRGDPVADIVAVREDKYWIIELKRSMSLDLIAQAHKWRHYAHLVSVGIPWQIPKRGPSFGIQILKDYGIGVLYLSNPRLHSAFNVYEAVPPLFQAGTPDVRSWKVLGEGHKISGKAGNAHGERWTPFRQTCWNLWSYLSQNPGSSLNQIVSSINHHYQCDGTARSSLSRWIKEGAIKGVQVDTGKKPFKYFLKDGFDWESQAKQVT